MKKGNQETIASTLENTSFPPFCPVSKIQWTEGRDSRLNAWVMVSLHTRILLFLMSVFLKWRVQGLSFQTLLLPLSKGKDSGLGISSRRTCLGGGTSLWSKEAEPEEVSISSWPGSCVVTLGLDSKAIPYHEDKTEWPFLLKISLNNCQDPIWGLCSLAFKHGYEVQQRCLAQASETCLKIG